MKNVTQRSQHLFGILLSIFSRGIIYCTLGILLTFIINAGLFAFLGHEYISNWLNALRYEQLHYLSTLAKHNQFILPWLNLIYNCYQWLYTKIDYGVWNIIMSIESMNSTSWIRQEFSANIPIIAQYTKLLMLTLCVDIIKLSIILLFIPLFMLFSFIGLVDGLGQRYIRRRSGDRERSAIHYQAKVWMRSIIIIGLVSYLALPLIMSPDILLMVIATLFAVATQLRFKYFRKYC